MLRAATMNTTPRRGKRWRTVNAVAVTAATWPLGNTLDTIPYCPRTQKFVLRKKGWIRGPGES
jgi:hypothetical protein